MSLLYLTIRHCLYCHRHCCHHGANDYKSATYAGSPHSIAGSVNDDNETYISALEETVARLTTEREAAFAAKMVTGSTPSTDLGKSVLHEFRQQLWTEMKSKMKKILAAATSAATAGAGTPSAATPGARNSGGHGHGRKNGLDLPVCPHCGKKWQAQTRGLFLPAGKCRKEASKLH